MSDNRIPKKSRKGRPKRGDDDLGEFQIKSEKRIHIKDTKKSPLSSSHGWYSHGNDDDGVAEYDADAFIKGGNMDPEDPTTGKPRLALAPARDQASGRPGRQDPNASKHLLALAPARGQDLPYGSSDASRRGRPDDPLDEIECGQSRFYLDTVGEAAAHHPGAFSEPGVGQGHHGNELMEDDENSTAQDTAVFSASVVSPVRQLPMATAQLVPPEQQLPIVSPTEVVVEDEPLEVREEQYQQPTLPSPSWLLCAWLPRSRCLLVVAVCVVAAVAAIVGAAVVLLRGNDSPPTPTRPPNPMAPPTIQTKTYKDLAFVFTGMLPMSEETSVTAWQDVSADHFINTFANNDIFGISNVTAAYLLRRQDPPAQRRFRFLQDQAPTLTILFDQEISYHDEGLSLAETELVRFPFATGDQQGAYMAALRATGRSAFANVESVRLVIPTDLTSTPTSDPTSDPTSEPTSDPTYEPTPELTSEPLPDRTTAPTSGPDPALPDWTQLGQDIVGEANSDRFGYSVSLSADGSVLAVGAYLNDSGGSNSGQTSVFSFNGMTWIPVGQTLAGENADDQFGRSISLSGDGSVLAVGAYRNDSNGSDSGHVRVFQLDGMTWKPLGQTLVGDNAGDSFGFSVSLSADASVLAVGARDSDDNGGDSGHVQVFSFNGMTWNPLGQTLVGENAGDWFGDSISLSADGNVLAVGARRNDGNGLDSGHVRVFQFDGMNWKPLGQTLVGESTDDSFGDSVSLSANGSVLAVGAYRNDSNGSDSGHVRVFSFDGTNWNALGQNLVGDNAGDYFGDSVSLSDDGSVLAVGAYLHKDNGDETGHVRVFQLENDAWEPLGRDISGKGVGDQFGTSVTMSANGMVVAAGADQWGKDGNPPGYASVYQLQQQ